MSADRRVVNSLRDLSETQVRLLLNNAVIEATGCFKAPPLDMEAIKGRADELDPKGQLKADIYLLIGEVEKLRATRPPG